MYDLRIMRCVLVGNYGTGNLGDEALKDYFLASFPDIEWITLSAASAGDREAVRLPAGLRSFCSLRWLRTLRLMHRCDAVVFGGGTLFTDIESVQACVIWGIHAWVARLLGKPVLLCFQGIGPFRTKAGERIARRVVRDARYVSVRDQASAARIREWGRVDFVQTFDPVFSVVQKRKSSHDTKNVFILIPRRNSGNSFMEEAHRLLDQTAYDIIRIVLMQPDDPGEQKIAEYFKKLCGDRAQVIGVTTLAGLIDAVRDASLVLSQRYHGALAALALGRWLVICPQEKDDKLSSLLGNDGKPLTDIRPLLTLVATGEESLRNAFGQLKRA